MKKQHQPGKRRSVASRLRTIASIQVVLCALLFLVLFINQPYQTFRQYQQDTTQTAALFGAIASGAVDTLSEASKYAGQLLNNVNDITFIRAALESPTALDANLAFCRAFYTHCKTLIEQNTFLDKIAVFDLDGNAVYVCRDRSSYYLTKSAAETSWFQRVIDARGGAVIIPPHEENSGIPPIFQGDLVVARAVFDPLKLRAVGIYLLTIPQDSLEAVFDAYRLSPEQEYQLIHNGQLLLSRFDTPIAVGNDAPLRELEYHVQKEEGAAYLYSTYRFAHNSYVIIRLPLLALLPGIFQINAALLAVVFMVLCLFILIIWRLINGIMRPLHSLTGALDAATGSFFPTIEPGDLPTDLEPLFTAYNRMTERIDLLVNEGLRKDVANRDIELQLLRTQINPHYLYNTLECLHMRAYVNHDFEVARMAELLGDNLQYGLRATNAKVTLQTEFEKAGEYMTLVGYHYGSRVRFDSHLDESIQSCMVVKLLLQPLIENAIQHGLTPERPLSIEVLGYAVDDETIRLQVSDDGEGMSEEACEALMQKLEEDSGERAIGLRNVHRRLKLRYGARYGVSVRSILNQSTVVTLTLPREYGEEPS